MCMEFVLFELYKVSFAQHRNGFFFLFFFFFFFNLKVSRGGPLSPAPPVTPPFPAPRAQGFVPSPRPALCSCRRLHFVYWFAPAGATACAGPGLRPRGPAAPGPYRGLPGPCVVLGPSRGSCISFLSFPIFNKLFCKDASAASCRAGRDGGAGPSGPSLPRGGTGGGGGGHGRGAAGSRSAGGAAAADALGAGADRAGPRQPRAGRHRARLGAAARSRRPPRRHPRVRGGQRGVGVLGAAEHRRGHRGHPGVAQPVPGGPALDLAGRLCAELPPVHGVQRGADAGHRPHGAQPGYAPGLGLQQLRAARRRSCSYCHQRLSLQHHAHLRHSPGPLVPLPAAGSCRSRALGQVLFGGSRLPGHRALCTQLWQGAVGQAKYSNGEATP